jgi:hypothetical protein
MLAGLRRRMGVLDVETPSAGAWRLGVGWEYAKELMPREIALAIVLQFTRGCAFVVSNAPRDGCTIASQKLVGVHFLC